MLAVLFTMLGLFAVGVFAEGLACLSAPVGYQDEAGFHFGPEPECHDDWAGNPS